MSSLRRITVAVAAGLLALALAQPSMARMDNDEVDITYVLYTKVGNVFWEPAIRGANEAAELLGVNIDIQYGDQDPVKQNNIIETAIANKVDGIAIAIYTPDAFTENVAKARAAGMGVVVFNIDDPGGTAATESMGFIGQDFPTSGYAIAKLLVERWGIKAGDHVAAPVELPDLTYAVKRYEGVKRAIDEVGATSEMFGTGVVMEEARTSIAQYLVGHPETDAVISLGGTPTAQAPAAIEVAGMEIPNGGFDINEIVMRNIMAGKTEATIDQQPYYQGFLPILFLANFKRYGLIPGDFNTGLAIVDRSNAEFVSELAGTYR
jgi:simple sugar transport system substrate-binding protein